MVSAPRRALSLIAAPFRACLGKPSSPAADALDGSSSRRLLPPASESPRSCAPTPDRPPCLRSVASRPLERQSSQIIAGALLKGMLSGRAERNLLAKDVLLRLEGEQLLHVKEALEASSPGVLCGFVYGNGHIEPHRRAIVDHMAASVPTGARPLYVLSDIDNTFSPTRDVRYPKGTQGRTYPGQAALYAALAGSSPEQAGRERLTFLTARFGEPMPPIQCMARRTRRHTVATLQKLGVEQPNVLFGSLRYLPYPTHNGVEMAPLGTKKLVNFARMASLFPEYRYVFFGDSCEDDLRVATKMLQGVANKELDDRGPRPSYRAAAAFVHDFDGRAGKRVSAFQRHRAELAGVIFYTSALDAARAACVQEPRLGLGISPETVRSIARISQQELDAVPFTHAQQVERACLQSALDLEHAVVAATLERGVAPERAAAAAILAVET